MFKTYKKAVKKYKHLNKQKEVNSKIDNKRTKIDKIKENKKPKHNNQNSQNDKLISLITLTLSNNTNKIGG